MTTAIRLKPVCLISILLILSLILIACPQRAEATPATFSDLSPGHWAYQDITELVDLGVLGGYSDGTVRPDRPVTRQELAKICFSLFPGAIPAIKENLSGGPDYPDIHGLWGTDFLLVARNIAPGYTDGNYRPNTPASRQEVAVLLLHAALLNRNSYQIADGNLSLLVPQPTEEAWVKLTSYREFKNLPEKYRQANRYLEEDPRKENFSRYAGHIFTNLNTLVLLIEMQILRGYSDQTMRPERNVTRAEACAMALRLMKHDFPTGRNLIVEPAVFSLKPNPAGETTAVNQTLQKLGAYYQERYQDPLLRAKMLYIFMINNYSYHWEFIDGITEPPPATVEYTIKHGAGLSGNFALLYAQLADQAGLTATVVSGTAANPSLSGPHHWVELTIDGQTIEVDPTYGICTGQDFFNNFKHWGNQGFTWEARDRKKV
jgi:hypothetical protein